jgi:hypothetical protein
MPRLSITAGPVTPLGNAVVIHHDVDSIRYAIHFGTKLSRSIIGPNIADDFVSDSSV